MPEFLSTPSARRATPSFVSRSRTNCEFLSTPSARRATWTSAIKTWEELKFLSTPSARRATARRSARAERPDDFYPRPPRRGRPSCVRQAHPAGGYFYPRPPRGGRRHGNSRACHSPAISIHALREEGDRDACSYCRSLVEFLSTPSARRATRCCQKYCPGCRYFYPRPPRGGRRFFAHGMNHSFRISIHALREEGDVGQHTEGGGRFLFLSTPSARRATVWILKGDASNDISIHALREEGDGEPCLFSGGRC